MTLIHLASYHVHHCPAGDPGCYNNVPWWTILIVAPVAIGVAAYRRWRSRGAGSASGWSRIAHGIVGGVRINERIRITPLLGSRWGGAPYLRPPGVNAGTWSCYGNLIWVRLGNPESWPGEDVDAKMIDPVEP